MERNSFKEAYKSYRVNKTLATAAAIGTIGGIATLSFNFATLAMYFTLVFLHTSQKTYEEIAKCDEYTRFNEIYNFVFEELIKNMDTFEMKSIEEIFTYFTVIIHNGYLNYDKNMKATHSQQIINELSILEALCLNKHGECRNISPMLSHLINHYGFETDNLCCDYRYGWITYEDVIEQNNVQYANELEILKAIEKRKLDLSIEAYKEKYPKKTKYKPNHIITQANDQEHTYYLGTAPHNIFVPIPGRNEEYVSFIGNYMILKNQSKKEIVDLKIATKHHLEEKKFKDMFEILYNLKSIEDTLINNQDIIEEMYKHTKPALEEAEAIYEKILLPNRSILFGKK